MKWTHSQRLVAAIVAGARNREISIQFVFFTHIRHNYDAINRINPIGWRLSFFGLFFFFLFLIDESYSRTKTEKQLGESARVASSVLDAHNLRAAQCVWSIIWRTRSQKSRIMSTIRYERFPQNLTANKKLFIFWDDVRKVQLPAKFRQNNMWLRFTPTESRKRCIHLNRFNCFLYSDMPCNKSVAWSI